MEGAVLTTLGYVEKDGCYLLIHRTKKKNDINKDKYIGIGGHVEERESPEECMLREAREEAGIELKNLRLRGILTFLIDDLYEMSFLYTADSFEGELIECDEGELVWVKKEEIANLPIWEGDRIFLYLLHTREDVFSLKLTYVKDVLQEVALDGTVLEDWHIWEEEVKGL
ncbi:8-oxo-dGTP diphosphatase [Lachnospiraceae bacterium XBB1006]|nr:8-oxo-dGTP diphosphatase [Lachnospiraceae bacterium XBB1006]